MSEHDQINEALLRFLHTGWLRETERDIEAAYSAEVAAQTKAVYDAAMGCPVDWRVATMDVALAVLADFLPSRFPWLVPEAKVRLNYCYIMTWK